MNCKPQSWLNSLLILVLISSLTLVGCDPERDVPVDSANNKPVPTETSQPTELNNNMANLENYARLDGKATVQFIVNGSPITIEVDGENAPITAGNFIDLIERGVYDGLVFHRVVKTPQPFVAQGGDPQGKDPNFPTARLGTGGFIDPQTNQQRYIPLEIKLEGEEEPTYGKALGQQGTGRSPAVVLPHRRGAVAMARSQPPDSASSQFYFALADLAFLDGDYAVFGYVTEGMDIVDSIEQGDRIDSATVLTGIENFKK